MVVVQVSLLSDDNRTRNGTANNSIVLVNISTTYILCDLKNLFKSLRHFIQNH